MKVTTEILKRELEWEKIEDGIKEGDSRFLWKKWHWTYHKFSIMPLNKNLPSIDFLFDVQNDEYSLIHVAFGGWHTHFENSNEKLNFSEAIKFVKDLIFGKRYLVKQINKSGKYVSGAVMELNGGSSIERELFKSFRNQSGQTLKVIFNEPIEEITKPTNGFIQSSSVVAPEDG